MCARPYKSAKVNPPSLSHVYNVVCDLCVLFCSCFSGPQFSYSEAPTVDVLFHVKDARSDKRIDSSLNGRSGIGSDRLPAAANRIRPVTCSRKPDRTGYLQPQTGSDRLPAAANRIGPVTCSRKPDRTSYLQPQTGFLDRGAGRTRISKAFMI